MNNKICIKCGKGLNQGEMFCSNCGTKVENSNIVGGNTLNQNAQNQTMTNFDSFNNTVNQSKFNKTLGVNALNNKPSNAYSLSIAGVCCSLVGLFIMGFPFGYVAISCGVSALKEMSKSENKKGKGLAITAVVLGIIDIIGLMITMVL